MESKGAVAILYLEENNGRLGIIIVSLLLVGMGVDLKRQGLGKGCSGETFLLGRNQLRNNNTF